MSELKDWFELWWGTLPKELFTGQTKGSKAEAWIQTEKLNPDKELQEHIMWYTRERMLRDRKRRKQDIKISPWKHAVRLIRHRFWEDELPDTRPDQNVSELTKCQCGKPVAVGKLCNDCYDATHPDPWEKDRKERLASLGILRGCKNKQDVIEACKNYNRQSGVMERTLKVGASGSEGNL